MVKKGEVEGQRRGGGLTKGERGCGYAHHPRCGCGDGIAVGNKDLPPGETGV